MNSNVGSSDNLSVYFVGLDGGGSHCCTHLYDTDGNFIPEGLSGAANAACNFELSLISLNEAIEQALTASNINDQDMSYLLVGVDMAELSV